MSLESKTASTAVVMLLASTVSSGASAVAVGVYNLSNHPDGGAAPPLYGLRLDGLLTGDKDDTYTFDFDHASSAMTMTYDGSKIVIDGTAYGGEDNGSGYEAGTTAVWTIHFEYTVGVSQPGGEGGLNDVFVNDDYSNFGTISSVLGNFELANKANGSGLSFQLGDEAGGGHRGHNDISGWGWLRHGTDCLGGTDCSNEPYSDWLFTASPVPVPAAAWLFGSALLGLVGLKHKR
jgi:hypothetical protein